MLYKMSHAFALLKYLNKKCGKDLTSKSIFTTFCKNLSYRRLVAEFGISNEKSDIR